MQSAKHYFAIPYISLVFLASLFSLWQLYQQSNIAWLGASLAVIPFSGFFIYLGLAKTARTSKYLSWHFGAAVLGSAMTVWDFQAAAFIIAADIGLAGGILYIFWYTPLNRKHSKIVIGEALPAFTLHDIDGNIVSSELRDGRKKIWVFIRGNWCPLCVAQVTELAADYKRLHALGADVYFISSQSADQSSQLAKRFDAPMRFLVDNNNAAAIALGIEHLGGVPFGMPGYDVNTAMPTVIISDENNRVLFADQTDDYRIRPEPELFIEVLQGAKKPNS